MRERIELTDSLLDVMLKMSEGNPGAASVCAQLMKETPQIDPDNIMGGMGVILSLDDMGVRGPKIWMLYKDVCKENLTYLNAVMRGRQLGHLSSEKIQHAIEHYGEGLDLPAILAKVQSELPAFGGLTPHAADAKNAPLM